MENNRITHLQQTLNKYSQQGYRLAYCMADGCKNDLRFWAAGGFVAIDGKIRNSAIRTLQQKHKCLGFDLYKKVFTLVELRWVKPVSKWGLYDKWARHSVVF